MRQKILEMEAAIEQHQAKILEAAIEQTCFEIAKCESLGMLSWHFKHERQHWILERIIFFMDNEDWWSFRGF